MLKDLGIEWKGIVNVGDAASYKADILILNVPIEFLFDPREWWGLFHEIGHIVSLVDKRFFDVDDSESKYFFHHVIGVKENDVEWIDLLDLTWEVAADIFDYQFGFNADLTIYHKVVWEYLGNFLASKKITDEKIANYIFRSVCISIYDRLRANMNGVQEITAENVDQDVRTLLENENVKKLGKELIANDTFLSETTLKILKFKTLLMHFRRQFGQFDELVKAKRDYMQSAEFDSIIQTLRKGQIYWGKITYPETIIYSMKKEGAQTFESSIALILTFWHAYVQQFALTQTDVS
jgi:hypothetical protein